MIPSERLLMEQLDYNALSLVGPMVVWELSLLPLHLYLPSVRPRTTADDSAAAGVNGSPMVAVGSNASIPRCQQYCPPFT
jgi:hypothetical protein